MTHVNRTSLKAMLLAIPFLLGTVIGMHRSANALDIIGDIPGVHKPRPGKPGKDVRYCPGGDVPACVSCAEGHCTPACYGGPFCIQGPTCDVSSIVCRTGSLLNPF